MIGEGVLWENLAQGGERTVKRDEFVVLQGSSPYRGQSLWLGKFIVLKRAEISLRRYRDWLR